MKYAARFLVVVLLLSLFTPCLQAEDALPFTYEIKNNEVILTSYTGPDSGTVVIPMRSRACRSRRLESIFLDARVP